MNASRHTVVVADDNEQILRFMRLFLEEEGYRVLTCANGEEAIRLCEQKTVDLLITDLDMPVMDGLEAITTLSLSRPQLPIIAACGSHIENMEMAKELGAARAFSKPYDFHALSAAVRELLEKPAAKV